MLRLPYKGSKFAMYILLPRQIDGLDEMLAKIHSYAFRRAQYLLEEVEITVALPKFKIENKINLNEILKDLGIRQIFTDGASIPYLARGAIVQKTGIEVNEKGSTTFETTQISLSHNVGGDFEFIANRPFLFVIEDETTGTLIFSGKIMHPQY